MKDIVQMGLREIYYEVLEWIQLAQIRVQS
jgi:hypothetical protein